MPVNAYGKNNALAGATAKMLFVGGFSSVAKAPTSGTAINGTLINMTGSQAAGWTNGKLVVVRALTPGVTGLLVVKRQLYIVGEVANGFELATEEGGTAIKVTGHELEAATTKLALLTELSGGGYARQATKWKTPKNGETVDENTVVIKVPAGKEITDIGYFEKVTVGSGATGCQGTEECPTPEPFTGEGPYTVSTDNFEADALA